MTEAAEPADNPFHALDACHLQMQKYLAELQRMVRHVEGDGPDEADRKLAAEIQDYFSTTARDHHAQEEATVFAPLLAHGTDDLQKAVYSLQQDHGFIEENWLELGPQLRAVAEGNDWFDSAELQHNVQVFIDLVHGHIALEESLIYPESKLLWAQAVARRAVR